MEQKYAGCTFKFLHQQHLLTIFLAELEKISFRLVSGIVCKIKKFVPTTREEINGQVPSLCRAVTTANSSTQDQEDHARISASLAVIFQLSGQLTRLKRKMHFSELQRERERERERNYRP